MYASIAADMAADAADAGHRASLLEMARVWQKLAEKSEAPRAVQQQQQPQSNDNDKK
jgi:NAD-dependent oxidoreductase involved in siderophore biosynthesis